MAGLQVFRVSDGDVRRVKADTVELERHLQALVEANMEEMLGGVRFLASEYSTGPVHRGRIDSLGLDEDGSPVLIEYKRQRSESVLAQGLFYLSWLVENRAEFEALVEQRLGTEAAEQVDWSRPRVVCIAAGFTRYDLAAAGMSHHRIDMVVYRRYGDDLVTLELAASVAGGCGALPGRRSELTRPVSANRRTVTDMLAQSSSEIRGLYEDLDSRLLDLGEGHSVPLQHYVAYRRRRNFACVRVLTREQALVVFLRVDPTTVQLVPGWTRDVRRIGHLGTGELEVRIGSVEDLDRSMALLRTSYAAAA
ncbi:DUF5655 domain-containing protein [Kitasatospora sp. NPDC051984]|uniref:DUF5655 domain-containing protein n=1 Tax=Kitasatospora sp. NPDC051984 TaxID=3364059 RepID=UPI0037CBC462